MYDNQCLLLLLLPHACLLGQSASPSLQQSTKCRFSADLKIVQLIPYNVKFGVSNPLRRCCEDSFTGQPGEVVLVRWGWNTFVHTFVHTEYLSSCSGWVLKEFISSLDVCASVSRNYGGRNSGSISNGTYCNCDFGGSILHSAHACLYIHSWWSEFCGNISTFYFLQTVVESAPVLSREEFAVYVVVVVSRTVSRSER